LLEQVALDTPDIDHSRRANHHGADPESAAYRSFVIAKGALEGTYAGFDGGPKPWLGLKVGQAALTPQGQGQVSQAKAKRPMGR
jgi:hypothetical protein